MLSSLLPFLLLSAAHAKGYKETWVIEEWVVDFLRPTINLNTSGTFPWNHPASRVSPYKMKDEQRSNKYLVNGVYPGPTIQADLGDDIEILVINKMASEGVSLHWHGMHQPGTPFMDGSRGVAQAAIMPGMNFTYKFKAFPEGTHYWHAHMDSVQSAKGLKGPIVIKNPADPFEKAPETHYDEELVIAISDEWRMPEVCLRLEGAMPGNDVCADVRWGSFNGQYGNGSKEYPWPIVHVEHGKCYRLRLIMMSSNAENFIFTLAGHNMTLLSLDGSPVKPIQVTEVNLHLGERADVRICADQAPGNYLMTADYDYACSLLPGNFIPPGFSPVPYCKFFAFLNYKSHKTIVGKAKKDGDAPVGTGGGEHPKPVTGKKFDLTNVDAWNMTRPLYPEPEPAKADLTITINLGLKGPKYENPTDTPLSKGRWYMDSPGHSPRPWTVPSTPLMHTMGECGVGDIPIYTIPENVETVEVIINNLSPTAHNLHMHGNYFKVINYMNFPWCNINRTDCFTKTHWANSCDREDVQVGDPDNPNLVAGMYWGCAYNEKKDRSRQNLDTPLFKDSFEVWQRSWAVIRFKADNPGWWYFHCHMEQHIPLGMQTIFNILPSHQPPIPNNVPTSGWCPVKNPEKKPKTCEETELHRQVGQLEDEVKRLRRKLEQL